VAPWQSVYKINLLADTEITFLLTAGGHNAGIISEPGRDHRHYRMATKKEHETYLSPDEWFAATPVEEGSWWPAWQAWLAGRAGNKVNPPPLGHPKAGYPALCDAPGTYVLEE
jgi:polyhydroxyalkanoate synthase